MILSSHLILLIISGYTLVVDCMPSPQEASVSLDDILQAAGNDSSRYGTNSGPVDQSALCNVFGGPDCQNNGNNANAEINNRPEYDTNDDDYLTDPDVGNPTVKVSKKSDNCSYFEEFGFELSMDFFSGTPCNVLESVTPMGWSCEIFFPVSNLQYSRSRSL